MTLDDLSPRRTVLVTGAAGFIGSNVVNALLARGDRVVGLDNLNAYYAPALKRANVGEISASAPVGLFEFVEGDVRDRDVVERLFDGYQFDAVAHLAAMAGVRGSVDDPGLYYSVNLTGTLALLDAARSRAVAAFVLASTSSVYGETDRIPFVETDTCDRPLAPYAASKRAAEMLAYTYHHLYGLNVTVLRFFTVYGPRNRPDMLAHKILTSIFSGSELSLYNGGHMHRDWTYVGDITAGVVAALERPLGYEIFNLGRGEPVLVAEFIRIIEDLVGRRASLVSVPAPQTEISTTLADISKARSLLGYNPTVSVEQGVERLWDWYRHSGIDTSS